MSIWIGILIDSDPRLKTMLKKFAFWKRCGLLTAVPPKGAEKDG